MLRRTSVPDVYYRPYEVYSAVAGLGGTIEEPSSPVSQETGSDEDASVDCPEGWWPCDVMPPGVSAVSHATIEGCCQPRGFADCVEAGSWSVGESIPSLVDVRSDCGDSRPTRCRLRSADVVIDYCCDGPTPFVPGGFVLEGCSDRPAGGVDTGPGPDAGGVDTGPGPDAGGVDAGDGADDTIPPPDDDTTTPPSPPGFPEIPSWLLVGGLGVGAIALLYYRFGRSE